MVKIVNVNEDNLDDYGLFCRKSYMREEGNKKKVEWLKKRFKEGLKFKLLLVQERGKENSRGFIEYIPGKYAWRGINAEGWMTIICLWVTGKAKNKGYGSKLLNEAIEDAKKARMHGVVGMTADKQGWLPRPDIYQKNGFEKMDDYEPYFSLYAKQFSKDAPNPSFKRFPKEKKEEYTNGITILHTYQCPHIMNMIDEIRDFADENGIAVNQILLESAKEVQEMCVHPYGTFSVLYEGELVTYKPGMRKETINRLKEKRQGK